MKKHELLIKSREAMLAAVQIYNNPQITFKSEIFISMAIISWTYLMHTYYANKGIDYRYYSMRGKRKCYDKTKCDYCGKKLTEHTGGKATCKDKAKCEVCGAEYGELDAKNHTDLKHFPATAATKTTEGNIEYWYCEGCGKYYSDKDGTKEIKKADTVTAKLKDDSKSSQTGDTSNLALWIALLFVSGGAAIGTTVVSRKKKYNR